jgi:light-harvesting protein B-800-850 alpha chain
MNQARIWLIVKPSIGVPVLLVSVVLASLIVHFALLTHTTWFPAFWQGGQKKAAMIMEPVTPTLGSLT